MAAEPPANLVFGSVKVQADEPKFATQEEILAIAKQIAASIRAEPPKSPDLLKRLQAAYPAFAGSFPVALQLMADTREFAEEPMRRYLRWYAKQRPATMDDFLGAQAEYLVRVFCHKSRQSPGSAEARRIRQKSISALKEETRRFVEIAEDVERDFKEREASASRTKREALADLLRRRLIEGGPPPGGETPRAGAPAEQPAGSSRGSFPGEPPLEGSVAAAARPAASPPAELSSRRLAGEAGPAPQSRCASGPKDRAE